MQQVRIQIQGPGGGPGKPPGLLARILLSIVAVIVLASAAFLGAVFFLAALGFFVIATIVVSIRLWWLRRQMEAAMRRGEQPTARRPGERGSEDVIEGEYRVMSEGRRDPQRPDGQRPDGENG
ncbi:hypothetical protein [Thioalkalivibrio sp. XN8]|uniref:hypothetical protein n=1 Tax=Thioalkalivibrio sp. XN8 TaxID=2712863 RepID=UPI0013EDF558|nr:hypothetical protein [Thioalkalivibrio sp. XN8]NGP54789.1 hypothetical protein [Thioalkalivibrio sp. XN8]